MEEEKKDKQEETSQEELASEWEKMIEESQEKEEEQPEEEKLPEDERIKLFLDIPVEISVEIGSARLPLEEVMKLHPSSVIELERYIDEPVDIKINGKLVAKGELYMVKGNYGIKIKQIVTPEERLKLLEGD